MRGLSERLSIKALLAISFGFFVVIFVINAVVSARINADVLHLQHYGTNVFVARAENMLRMHHQLTAMRRNVRTYHMNSDWRAENPPGSPGRMIAQYLIDENFYRMRTYVRLLLESLENDTFLTPAQLESRFDLMEEISRLIDAIYSNVAASYFDGYSPDISDAEVSVALLEHIAIFDDVLSEGVDFAISMRNEAIAQMEQMMNFSDTLSRIMVVICIVIALFAGFILLHSIQSEKQDRESIHFMFENMPLICTFFDKDYQIIDCNDEAVRKFRAPGKKVYIDNWDRLFSPEFQADGTPSGEYARKKIAECFATGKVYFNYTNRDYDGNLFPVEIIGVRGVFRGAEVVIAYARDVSELQQARAWEREAAERAQIMFDATPLIIELWNKDRQLIDCNPYTLEKFGLATKADYLAAHDKFSPQMQQDGTSSLEYWLHNIDRVFESGHHEFSMILKDHNNELVYTDVVGMRLKFGGEFVAITYSVDVTYVEKSMRAIREQAHWYWNILDALPLNIAVMDTQQRWTFVNRSLERVLGKPRDELLGCCCHGWGSSICNTEQCSTKRFKRGELSTTASLGNRDYSVTTVGLKDTSGETIGYIEIGQDITELNKYQQNIWNQQQQMKIVQENSLTKTKFLAKMSHEIRTPISAVLGIAEIQLQNVNLSIETQEAFVKIFNSAEVLLSIINDILDISKIEAGKMDILENIYEIASLIADTIQMHNIYLESKRIRFSIDIDPDIPAYFVGDELRIKQILNNLISNAFKYTQVGRVTIAISCEQTAHNDDGNPAYLCIKVTDTGRGMTPEQLQDLQTEYARFHEREDRYTPGTGLGMSIVYNLVRLMGGTITVESEVGVGTVVMLRLPQIKSGDGILGEATAKNLRELKVSSEVYAKRFAMKPEPMPYGHVLIVDDVETNLYVAKGLMRLYDLKIETAESGDEAVEKIKQGCEYDIIFMDHMMPGISGMEAMRILRKLGYTRPIVALTANALIGQAEEFIKSGFDGFLSKPIQTMHLNSVLCKFVRDKQPPEVLEAARNAAVQNVAAIDDYFSDPHVQDKILRDFYQSHSQIDAQIAEAARAGDFAAAHRFAHTLKGLAGIIGEVSLTELARRAEALLGVGGFDESLFAEISREVARVMKKIEDRPGFDLHLPTQELDAQQAQALLDDLRALLVSNDAMAISLVDSLLKVPGSEGLVADIKSFEFEAALEKLQDLRSTMAHN